MQTGHCYPFIYDRKDKKVQFTHLRIFCFSYLDQFATGAWVAVRKSKGFSTPARSATFVLIAGVRDVWKRLQPFFQRLNRSGKTMYWIDKRPIWHVVVDDYFIQFRCFAPAYCAPKNICARNENENKKIRQGVLHRLRVNAISKQNTLRVKITK